MKQTNKALKAKILELENQIKKAAEDKKYNGWTNYETWLVKLWMDNDEGSQDYTREQATEIYKNTVEDASNPHYIRTRLDKATYELMKVLRDEFSEQTPDMSGVYADLLTGAISEVNWHEIAENIMAEISLEVDKEEAEELAEV